MSGPPPGYDDQSVVPQSRLRSFLQDFEAELDKIHAVFQQYMPGHYEAPVSFDHVFHELQQTATELSEEYTFLIEKLISDYHTFQKAPDPVKLEQLFSDVKSLQLLLTG